MRVHKLFLGRAGEVPVVDHIEADVALLAFTGLEGVSVAPGGAVGAARREAVDVRGPDVDHRGAGRVDHAVAQGFVIRVRGNALAGHGDLDKGAAFSYVDRIRLGDFRFVFRQLKEAFDIPRHRLKRLVHLFLMALIRQETGDDVSGQHDTRHDGVGGNRYGCVFPVLGGKPGIGFTGLNQHDLVNHNVILRQSGKLHLGLRVSFYFSLS